MEKPLNASFGAFVGTVVYVSLAFALDAKFRPFPTDMPVWIIAAIPTGIFLGGASGLSVSCSTISDHLLVGIWCVILSVITGYIYSYFLNADISEYNNYRYALSASGPALIWSVVLLARGVWLVWKGLTWKKASQHS